MTKVNNWAWVSSDGQSELWLGEAENDLEAMEILYRQGWDRSGRVYPAVSEDGGKTWREE